MDEPKGRLGRREDVPHSARKGLVDPEPTGSGRTSERGLALFDDFYAEERPGAVRLAALIVGDSAVAEELAQDAFVKVCDRWDQLDRPAAFLRTCVVNAGRSWIRRRVIARRSAHKLVAPAVSHDEIHELSDALAALSVRQRTAIVLRFYVDLPETEIAQVMGCRPGTVKSTLHRALERLGEEL